MDIVIKKKDIRFTLFLLVYRLILDGSYVFVISPLYSYSGLTLNIDTTKMIISYLLMFVISAIMDRSNGKVSSMILQYHYMVMIVPLLSFYALNNQSSVFIFMIAACFILEIVLLKGQHHFKLINITHANIILFTILPAILIFTVAIMLGFNGLSLQAIDFSQIYGIRKSIQYPAAFFSYLWTWCYRIINPFFIVIMYLKKRKSAAAFFIFLQLVMYFITPHKEILFAPILVVGCIFLIKRFNFFNSVLLILASAIALFTFTYYLTGQIMPVAIIPNRLLVLPAQGKFEHFEYFSQFTKLYFSEGLIGKILNIPYPYGNLSSGNVIALYFQGVHSNSNTGYLAYAYDNLGFWGMLLSSFLFVIVMKYFDSVSDRINKNVIFALSIYPFAMLNDGDILTALLTGGVILLMLMLSMYNENELSLENNSDRKIRQRMNLQNSKYMIGNTGVYSKYIK